jgi:hypothetical protein
MVWRGIAAIDPLPTIDYYDRLFFDQHQRRRSIVEEDDNQRLDCSYDELLDVVGALRHRADVFDSLRTLVPRPEYKALSVGLSNAYFRSLGLPSLFDTC